MPRKKPSVNQVVDQYAGLLDALRQDDPSRAVKLLDALPPGSAHGFLSQVLSGNFRVDPKWEPWIISRVEPGEDQGYVMTSALMADRLDLLPLLHDKGLSMPHSKEVADAMVRSLAQGNWPHPDLLWPDVIDAAQGQTCWARLLMRSSNLEHSLQGLRVDHLQRIEGLSHQSRPIPGLSVVFAMLGWEGDDATRRFQEDPEKLRALGWMYQNGWIAEDAILATGSANKQWQVHMDQVISLAKVQAQALDIDRHTPAVRTSRASTRL